MTQQLKNLHLPQRLIERLNSEVFEMSYTLIADYLLRNYRNIKKMTVEEVCDSTYVSKSTLRRFCNHIGYKNFTELKMAYVELKDDNISYQFNQNEEYLKIVHSIQNIDLLLIDQLIDNIRSKKYIFFLFPYDLYSPFYDFQREMLVRGKLVHLMPNIDLHYDDTKSSLNESLIFIIDFDSSYIDTIIPYLDKINSTNILLTNQKRNYDKALITINFDDLEIKSLRKYQLSLFLDIIINKYYVYENV